MTEEPINPYAAPSAVRPAAPMYDEPGTASTASVIAWGIALVLGGLILFCSGLSVLEMISNYLDPPDHFAGFVTGHCVLGLLGVAGVALFIVLIEFRRRMFLILMGSALAAVAVLCAIAAAVYGF